MRVFVGVPIDLEATDQLAAWAATLDLPGRLVPPTSWHLTLRFVGQVDEVGVDRLAAALDERDFGESFRIRFGPVSAFPRPARATVAHVTVDRGGAELTRLADDVNEEVDHAGFGLEERPYVAHLTLSRIRPPHDLRPLVNNGSEAGIQMAVDGFALYRSHLGRGGARYEVLERFSLT